MNLHGIKILAFLTIICFGFASFADVCSTQSRGIYFVSFDQGTDHATSDVLQQCESCSITYNTECANNLACGGNASNPYSSGTAACYTSSHGIAFQAAGDFHTVSPITQSVIQQCRQTSVTSNTECDRNVACADYSNGLPYPSGRVACTTSSHSISFQKMGDAQGVTNLANATVADCLHNSVTSDTDCSNNLSCRDAGTPAPVPVPSSGVVTCTTSSHQINFSQSGPRSRTDQVSQAVLNQCVNNAVTNNTECSQNLSCN